MIGIGLLEMIILATLGGALLVGLAYFLFPGRGNDDGKD